jgi:hypothetical protein
MRTSVAVVLVLIGCGDSVHEVDASCPVSIDASAPDATLPIDAAVDDAGADAARQLTVRWSFTENGVPVPIVGEVWTVIVSDGPVPRTLGAAAVQDFEMTVQPGTSTLLRLVATDFNFLPIIVTFAPVPTDSDVLDVVLPYIDEPRDQLNDLAARVRTWFEANGGFPSAGDTPSFRCCSAFPSNVCAADPAAWTAEPWATLGFAVSGAHRFNYAIITTGSGSTAEVHIRAQADWDCDTVMQTWTIHGRIDASGQLVYAPLNIDRPTE